MIPFDFGVSKSKVKVTVTLNIKSCLFINLKPIQFRDTIIDVLVSHDPKMIHFDFEFSSSKKVTVTLSNEHKILVRSIT